MSVISRYSLPLALTAIITVVMVGGINFKTLYADTPEPVPQSSPEASTELQQRHASFERHFYSGIDLLQEGRPVDAIAMFDLARKARPDIPEVHINMGFAYLDMGQWQNAHLAFNTATKIRPNLGNAYFGIAEAQEGLNNLTAAVAAMTMYLHLAKSDDPFRIKAEAAIWEWQAILAKSSLSDDSITDSVSSTGNNE